MKVITISRSYGAAGTLFGRELAQRLRYHYVDEGFVTKAARNKEVTGALIENLEDENAPDLVSRVKDLMSNRNFFKIALATAVYDLVLQKDVILVGGGGHLILQDYPALISVQVVRNLVDRVRGIAEEKQVSYEEALGAIEKKDKEKERFVGYYFEQKLFDPVMFHFTVNSSHMALEDALSVVAGYAEKHFSKVDMGEAETFLKTRLLQKRAQLTLFQLDLTRAGKVELEVFDERNLTVKGVVGGKEEKERLLKRLRNLKGVDRVTDQLKVGILSRLIY
jgi:cytidylate kinase